jgi:hypothetical protein
MGRFSILRFGQSAIAAVAAIALIGCSGEEKPAEVKGKFESSSPPPGYVEEKMKNRTTSGAPDPSSLKKN